MAFRFALAPLLRLRQGLEHQCALVLQKACFNVGRAREALDRLDRFRDDCARANSGALATGQTAAELQFAALVRDQMKQLHLRLQDEITRLEGIRQEAARMYQRAQREREALEALCTRQKRMYQLEQMRKQQRELDTSFLLQRWHNRTG